MGELRELGFEAFVPFNEFYESFAENQEELELHRKCVIEAAKNRLGRPWPLRAGTTRYVSPFIEKLCEQRDRENGVPVEQLSVRFPGKESLWRYEVEPVGRRRVQTEVNTPELYGARWDNVQAVGKYQLEQEAAQHSTELSKRFSMFDKRGRYDFVTAVMERDATSYGFFRDKSKSTPDNPVYSKELNFGWDLCLVIEDPKLFYWGPLEGCFDTRLVLCNRRLVRKLSKAKPDQYLYIRISNVVPGFAGGYRNFGNLSELETSIKAHLSLFGLMESRIERAVDLVLGHGRN